MKKKIFAIIMISVHILHIHIQSFISFNWEGKKISISFIKVLHM